MKPPIASYTFLSTWLICPHQAFRRYIAKDLPREPQTPQMAWGNEVHEAMQKRLRNKMPLPTVMVQYEKWCAPLDVTHLEPEMELGVNAIGRPVDFWDKDGFLRGKLDVPILLTTDVAVLLDWKTGNVREDPFELEIGALLLQARRPELRKIYGKYVWLKEDRSGQTHDVSDTVRTWRRVNDIMDEVKACTQAAKTRGPLCGWCPVTDCQHNTRRTK